MKINNVWKSNQGVSLHPNHLSAFGDLRTAELKTETGWTFQYNINSALINTIEQNGGTVNYDRPMALLNSGTNPNGLSRIETKKTVRYTPGVGAVCRFTAVFGEPQENSIQMMGLGDFINGWGFGYNGTSFGVVRCSGGVRTWYPQEEWNVHKRMAELDPQKGNVYEIKYQWLGFGMQTFSIENPQTGMFEVVHSIIYANNFDVVSVINPTLPICANVLNEGNTTPITMKTSSAFGGIEGKKDDSALTLNLAQDNLVPLVGGVERPIISFLVSGTWQGVTNTLHADPLRLSLSSEGAKNVIFRAYSNPTLTGSSFSYISEPVAPLQVDKSSTGVSGGLQVGSWSLGKADSDAYYVGESSFSVYPNQIVTITGFSTAQSEVTASVAFRQYL